MTRPNGSTKLILAAILWVLAGALDAMVVSEEWAQNWRDDLRFLARELPRVHPDPFTRLSSAEFESQIDQLIDEASEMSHSDLVVGLARVVAALGDGHTRVTLPLREDADFFLGHSKTPRPLVPGLAFEDLPLRLLRLDDGLWVWSAAREHAAAVGARVVKIGDKAVEEAIAAVAPIVHRDNPQQLDYQLPDYLVLPEVLTAVDVIDEPSTVEFTLAPAVGDPFVTRLEPVAGSVDWVDATEATGVAAPLYRRDNDRKFWFEYLKEDRAVYFQYNEVGDEEAETLAAFAERLFSFVDENPVDKLIIDLRRNRGGSNGLNKAVLHGLIRSEKLRQPGSLFAITGGGTFSAAMMFSVDLAKHTPALFVGSPTGSAPNHYGDSRKIRLPRTGLTVRVSTLYWQSDPRDDRLAIEPHLPVPTLMSDSRRGHDAALEAILRPGPPITDGRGHAGTWRGKMLAFRWTFDLTVKFDFAGSIWAGRIDLPELDVVDLPLEGVAIADGRIRFVLPDPDSDRRFVFTGRTEGERIYGNFSYASRHSPFVLTRQ